MEELRQVAKAYYDAASEEGKQLADEFFKSMDENKDNKISLDEFLAFMRQEAAGCSRLNNPRFFKEVAKDGSELLDFWDVLTIYYIVKSGRPFCDRCGVFVMGLYFSCVKCFQTKCSPTFNLCFECFNTSTGEQRCIHQHTNFLDNYTLLQAMRNIVLADAEAAEFIKKRSELTNLEWQTTSKSQDIVLESMASKRSNAAFKALEIRVNVASNQCCSIL